MSNTIYNLSTIILNDLIKLNKKLLVLLVMITISSILTITIIHKTRLLISQEETLNILAKKERTEWKNLILERNLLTSHKKIEKNAIKQLKMTYSNPSKENIFLQ
ncbi:MAG: cell division protein FtsL [Buchnera aphidicola (Meitanaphis elongallis)]